MTMPVSLADELAARRGRPVEQARTLPGHWYSDPSHHALEMDRVFARQWIGVAGTDAVEKPGSYLATTVAGGVPVLVVRGDDGELRAFLNVCRHRGAPVADGCGAARALSCPYHAWVYRLDGSLARATGVGEPEGFDQDDFGLTPVGVTTFARTVMVNLDPGAAPFDPGPLVEGLAPYRLEDLELGRTDRYEAGFNWKVLVENYSENYHTPFVHAQLIGSGYEYAMETTGDVVFAWDRPLAPRDGSEEALASATPGGPGWDGVAGDLAPESFNNGSYLTVFPNTMVSVFAGFAATFRLTPTGPTTTTVERDYLWHPSVDQARRDADYAATREVVAQDLEICEAVQRTYDGGLSAHGVLSTEHERGVHHVHQLLFAALAEAEALMAPRTRKDVDERRAQILEATREVALERGLAHLRVADVATHLDISSGLIHYHFSSKDELLVEMLASMANRDVARLRETVDPHADAVDQLDGVLREYLPAARRDESWALWIDWWDEALRSEPLALISSEFDTAWVAILEEIIDFGVEQGVFDCKDPHGASWRLSALLDGLAIQVVLPRRTLSRREMLDHARVGAAREVGLPRNAFPA